MVKRIFLLTVALVLQYASVTQAAESDSSIIFSLSTLNNHDLYRVRMVLNHSPSFFPLRLP